MTLGALDDNARADGGAPQARRQQRARGMIQRANFSTMARSNAAGLELELATL
jgi:hypothetical protein